jgi:hypothetical protein
MDVVMSFANSASKSTSKGVQAPARCPGATLKAHRSLAAERTFPIEVCEPRKLRKQHDEKHCNTSTLH